MKLTTLPLWLLSLWGLSAHAAIYPIPQQYDYRITRAAYNPENVIKIRTQIGTATLIQFEEGEEIPEENGLGIGDAQAWGLFVNKNHLFLKPTTDVEPDTNLTVVTTKGRTYSFWLELSDFPHFIVKMAYQAPKTASQYQTASGVPCYDGQVNFNYQMWGDKALAPKYAWDDGRFTCLKFTSKELPVAYQVADDGSESLINYHLQQDTMILQGTAREFRLRLGKQVLGLSSDDVQPQEYNDKASSIRAKRTVKHE